MIGKSDGRDLQDCHVASCVAFGLVKHFHLMGDSLRWLSSIEAFRQLDDPSSLSCLRRFAEAILVALVLKDRAVSRKPLRRYWCTSI